MKSNWYLNFIYAVLLGLLAGFISLIYWWSSEYWVRFLGVFGPMGDFGSGVIIALLVIIIGLTLPIIVVVSISSKKLGSKYLALITFFVALVAALSAHSFYWNYLGDIRTEKSKAQLLKDEELADAIRKESAELIGFSWEAKEGNLVGKVKVKFLTPGVYSYWFSYNKEGVYGRVGKSGLRKIFVKKEIKELSVTFTPEVFKASTNRGSKDPELCLEMFRQTPPEIRETFHSDLYIFTFRDDCGLLLGATEYILKEYPSYLEYQQ